MTPEEHARIGELFLSARGLAGAQREDFLRSHCPAALRSEVESLLGEDDSGPGALDTPALGEGFQISPTTQAPLAEDHPTRIGGCRIESVLGEGGFGIVYLARQTQPVEREVAIKVLKPGMDSRSVVRRFNMEQRVLASLRHPGIAPILDAGLAESGRPYFIMEYAPGEPIDAYCDAHRLSIPDRMRLFLDVCAAVDHAHQRGIIHRDLKPANVLVEQTPEGPRARVIDFGIAKAVNEAVEEGATQAAHPLGTPAYMSPEQMGGTDAVDIRSDVYALGVMLYEVLTGVRPTERPTTERPGADSHPTPPRPSSRLRRIERGEADRVASARGLTADQHRRALGREVEWIPMKAIRAAREERYASAAHLADDVRRFLRREPLDAGPDRAWYRIGKFTQRHRAAVVAALVVVAVVVVGAAIAAASLLEAARQGRLAESRLRDVERQSARAQISGADSALRAGQTGAAQSLLLDVPASRRGWVWRHLWAAADASLLTLAHDARVSAVEFCADGQVATAGQDGCVRFWAVDGSLLRTIAAHERAVTCLAVSGDGTRLASSGGDGRVLVWDVASGVVVSEVPPRLWHVQGLSFDASASRLAIVGSQGVTVWDLDARHVAWETSGHQFSVISARFDPAGDRLATLEWDHTVRLWGADGVPSGEPLRSPRTADRPTFGSSGRTLAWSPDGSKLAATSWDGRIVVWNAGDRTRIAEISTSQRGITALDFAPGGERVWSASSDGTVRTWDARSGDAVTVLVGHAAPIVAMALSSEADIAATADVQGHVRLWHTGIGEGLPRAHDPHRVVAVHSNRLTVAASQTEARFRSMGTDFRQQPPTGRHPIAVAAGGLLAVGSAREAVVLSSRGRAAHIASLRGHLQRVADVAISAAGGRVATASLDGVLALWRGDGEPLVLRGGGPACNAVAFEGERLVAGFGDGVIGTWDWRTGEPLDVATVDAAVTAVAPSSRGLVVATARGVGGQVRLVDDPAPMLTVAEGIHGIAVDEEHGRLAVAGGDGHAVIVPLDRPEERSHLAPALGPYTAVAWAPGLLFAGTAGGAVQVLSSDDCEHLLELRCDSDAAVSSIVFDAESDRVFASQVDGALTAWGTEPASRVLSALLPGSSWNDQTLPPPPTDGRFALPVSYDTGGRASSCLAADLTGDGFPELLVSNRFSESIAVLFNDRRGRFGAPARLPLTGQPNGLAAGDLDGDGDLDVIVTLFAADRVVVLLSDGAGWLQAASTCRVGRAPAELVLADIDEDGDLDALVACPGSDQVSCLLNQGSGAFELSSTIRAAGQPHTIVAQDLDADGATDLAIARYFPEAIDLAWGRGDSTFEPSVTIARAGGLWLRSGDINGDGMPDLISQCGPSGVSILLNKGSRRFSKPIRPDLPAKLTGVLAADVNGDGFADLIGDGEGMAYVAVALNDQRGGFETPRYYACGEDARNLISADLNGDGLLDLVGVNLGQEFFSPVGPAGVSVLLGGR